MIGVGMRKKHIIHGGQINPQAFSVANKKFSAAGIQQVAGRTRLHVKTKTVFGVQRSVCTPVVSEDDQFHGLIGCRSSLASISPSPPCLCSALPSTSL